MGGIHRTAHIEIDVCGFFKQQTGNLGGAILFVTPFGIILVCFQIAFRIGQHTADGDDPFGYQIHSLDGRGGRDLRIQITQRNQSNLQILRIRQIRHL